MRRALAGHVLEQDALPLRSARKLIRLGEIAIDTLDVCPLLGGHGLDYPRLLLLIDSGLMRRLLLGMLLAAAASLSIPLSASAASYTTFVGCDDLSGAPIPSHTCELGDFPGAYFESDVDTEYDVCVEFPGGGFLCAEEQAAEAGIVYVNSITTTLTGNHFVYWFVEGVEVGAWTFRMDAPVPPPLPIVPAPPALTPSLVPPVQSTACLKARVQIEKLKGQLRKATGTKRKSKIRAKLRKARAASRNAC